MTTLTYEKTELPDGHEWWHHGGPLIHRSHPTYVGKQHRDDPRPDAGNKSTRHQEPTADPQEVHDAPSDLKQVCREKDRLGVLGVIWPSVER